MPKTLLLADDSITIQKVVGISFANEDIELVTVDNGTDAVSRAREVRPDIVLADVVMPGLTGYEVCEAIKADPELSGTPVLLLTGTFETFDEARAAQAGADGHITKPFEAQALVDCVNERLAAGPSAATAPAAAAATPLASAPEADEVYDFLEDEITEPQEAPMDDATTVLVGDDSFSFDAPEDVDKELTLPPLGTATPLEPQATILEDSTTLAVSESVNAADQNLNADQNPDETSLIEEAAPEQAAVPLFEEVDGARAPATSILAWEETPALDDSFNDLLEPAAPGDLGALDAADPLLADPLAAEDPLAAVGPEDLAAESVLDPAGGRDYDVSSSDLGEPLAEIMAPPAAVFEREEVAAAPHESAPLDGLSAGEPVSVDEIGSELPEAAEFAQPTESQDDMFPSFAQPVRELAGEPSPEPLAEPVSNLMAPSEPQLVEEAEEEPSTSPLAEPALEPEPAVQLAPGTGPWPSPPPVETPAVSGQETPPESSENDGVSVPDLSPMVQQQLHDALERLAWEAFSDMSERIVNDGLERIEKVAWEVIPQMAEALIREEIRKLKEQE
jgi:CheY-like chemotaxis protein